MTMQIYREAFPEKILQQLYELYLISDKDQIYALYVNTFLGKIRDVSILTDGKLISWSIKIKNSDKRIIYLKKLKDITYQEKGIYGTITYQLSMKKNFQLQLNRQDGEKFFELSLNAWEKEKQRLLQ